MEDIDKVILCLYLKYLKNRILKALPQILLQRYYGLINGLIILNYKLIFGKTIPGSLKILLVAHIAENTTMVILARYFGCVSLPEKQEKKEIYSPGEYTPTVRLS